MERQFLPLFVGVNMVRPTTAHSDSLQSNTKWHDVTCQRVGLHPGRVCQHCRQAAASDFELQQLLLSHYQVFSSSVSTPRSFAAVYFIFWLNETFLWAKCQTTSRNKLNNKQQNPVLPASNTGGHNQSQSPSEWHWHGMLDVPNPVHRSYKFWETKL